MKNKYFLFSLVAIAFLTFALSLLLVHFLTGNLSDLLTQTVGVEAITSEVLASGAVHSDNEATIHFQTGGKLVFLAGKVGVSVYQGETIAQLDTYPLQKQLAAALNTYRSTRDTFDQVQQNSQTGVLQGQQRYGLDVTSKAGVTGDNENNIINDMAKRIIDQNQANLDNSVINVELANYALELATLSSPIGGVITSEDVTVPYQNITPLTSFSVADPTSPVFRANIPSNEIDFVDEGATAILTLDGQQKSLSGTVTKIYPQKMTLPTGEDVYQVDIHTDTTQSMKLGQSGTVLIQRNTSQASLFVPSWTIVGHNSIWILRNNKAQLVEVTVGKVYGDKTEILSGLTREDRVITSPNGLAHVMYSIL